MQEIVRIIIGIAILALGVPIGNFLAKVTKDEQKQGKFWFKLISILSLIGGFASLIFGSDILLFAFFFMAIVTSRSLSKYT